MDYSKLNLRIGLEIHQQINTTKLFCNCPSELREDNPDFMLKRKLRAASGELGEVDVAAQFEVAKNKEIFYEGYRNTTCLIETDECPPLDVNQDALMIALQVALLLKAEPVEESHVMRKIVLDGSNTTGFQRTMLIARDGVLETSHGKVEIATVCLEEEAARKISETEKSITYRLDRLGIPLIEITTKADIKTPEQCKEVAEKIGMILRSTGKVKRGIGTIRQDINLSILNHPRVELKGFQDLRIMPKVVDIEIERQRKLIDGKKKIISEVRKVNADGMTSFLRPIPGSARMYPETDVNVIKFDRKLLLSIMLPELISDQALKLEQQHNIQPEFAREIVKRKLDYFEVLVAGFRNIEPDFIARVIIDMPKEIRRRFNVDASNLGFNEFKEVLLYLNSGEIAKEAVVELLAEVARGNKIEVSKFKNVNNNELRKEIEKIVNQNKGSTFNAVMGIAMQKFRGKIDGKKIADTVRELLK